MGATEVIAVIFIALAVAGIFYYGLNSRGPWGSFWTFLLVVFFGMWIAAIWIEPVGPIWFGAAYLDLLFVGLLFAVLLAAATPRPPAHRRRGPAGEVVETERESAEVTARRETAANAVAVGFFFWALLILFLIAIAVGLVL